MNRRRVLQISMAAGLLPRAGIAQADWSPSRPVVIVVPFAPGGANDMVARLVAPHMQAALGQNVIVENRPGATGAIAARHVASQPADGHTVFVAAASTLTITPLTLANAGYDPERDFAPLTMALSVPNMLTVHKDVPARTVQDVVGWLKREDGRVAYASGGVGSNEQLGMELFLRLSGTTATHVPFSGGAPAVQAMLQGHCPVGILSSTGVRPHIQSGQLRGIAVAGPTRFAALPDIPTTHEAGFPQVIAVTWAAFVARAGTPEAATQRLHKTLVEALRQPTAQERLNNAGFTVEASSPEDLRRTISTELARWRQVVRDAQLSP